MICIIVRLIFIYDGNVFRIILILSILVRHSIAVSADNRIILFSKQNAP